jgi:hypothetical protein
VGNYYATRGGTVRPWAFWPFWRSNGATEHHRDSRTDSLRRWRERHLRSSSDSLASCLGGETTRQGARLGACFLCVIARGTRKARRSWVSSANRLVGREKAKQPTFVGELSRGARQPQGSGPIRRSWLVGRVNSQRSDGMRGFPARIGSWGEQNATEVALLGTVARGASEPSAPGVPTRLARGTGRTRRSYLSLESCGGQARKRTRLGRVPLQMGSGRRLRSAPNSHAG